MEFMKLSRIASILVILFAITYAQTPSDAPAGAPGAVKVITPDAPVEAIPEGGVPSTTVELPASFPGLPSFTTTKAPEKHYSGTYMVVAPKVVRPGLPYAVSVNILKSQESDHIVRVEIRTSQNETVGAKVVNNIKTGVPQTITIDNLSPESLLPGQEYKVYVRAETLDHK